MSEDSRKSQTFDRVYRGKERVIEPPVADIPTPSPWCSDCYKMAVLPMSAEINRKLFTYNDCVRMAETGVLSPAEKVELIAGEILLMSPPGPRHGAAVDRASESFRDLVKGKAIVRTQGTVVLDAYAAPLPDIALLAFRADYYVNSNPGASDVLLLVEVADSSLEYDTSVKLQLYAIAGISEYWVADLRNNRMLVYTKPSGDTCQSVVELHRGDTVVPQLLSFCSIPVDLLIS